MKNAQIMKKLYEGIKEINNPLKNGKKKKKIQSLSQKSLSKLPMNITVINFISHYKNAN